MVPSCQSHRKLGGASTGQSDPGTAGSSLNSPEPGTTGTGRSLKVDDPAQPISTRSGGVVAPLARWCFHHRRIVLSAWLLALVFMGGVSHAVGSSYANNFSFPSTDSSKAQDIVKANFPTQAGDSDQIVVQAKTGTLTSPEIRVGGRAGCSPTSGISTS